jgi:hypothetical protein
MQKLAIDEFVIFLVERFSRKKAYFYFLPPYQGLVGVSGSGAFIAIDCLNHNGVPASTNSGRSDPKAASLRYHECMMGLDHLV